MVVLSSPLFLVRSLGWRLTVTKDPPMEFLPERAGREESAPWLWEQSRPSWQIQTSYEQ